MYLTYFRAWVSFLLLEYLYLCIYGLSFSCLNLPNLEVGLYPGPYLVGYPIVKVFIVLEQNTIPPKYLVNGGRNLTF